MMHADSRRCGVAAAALLGTGALAQTASLTGLGIGNALQSVANTVSPNGRYVCGGFATPDHSVAFRWSRQDGLIMLGDLPGGPDISGASGVSNSGIVAGVKKRAMSGQEVRGLAATAMFRRTACSVPFDATATRPHVDCARAANTHRGAVPRPRLRRGVMIPSPVSRERGSAYIA